ncbi:hypothetical protein NE237_013474 [Protea cynaroides]|uniref:Uncharacterized protein n=1 Tax=Protea cynaroides TaxID=273540 RepID=A0A9Q0GYT7_9MAGN|nr:hypothetical protein NE237_013474 [Protea cynaroides]
MWQHHHCTDTSVKEIPLIMGQEAHTEIILRLDHMKQEQDVLNSCLTQAGVLSCQNLVNAMETSAKEALQITRRSPCLTQACTENQNNGPAQPKKILPHTHAYFLMLSFPLCFGVVSNPMALSTGQQFRNHPMEITDNFSTEMVDHSASSTVPQQLSQHDGAYDSYNMVAHEREVVPTVLDSQEMNTPIINNQNLNQAQTFPPTTWFESSIYNPTYEGLGLPMDPILRHIQQLSHKCGNHNNTSGLSQVDQVQLGSMLHQGKESSTESVPSHQNQGLIEMVSTNNVALLQNNEHRDFDLSTKGVPPYQSQNAQILNEESVLSSQGSASPTIEASVDLQLPKETIEDLMRDLWPNIGEGQQNQMPNLQQEEQMLFDEGSIHFQQQDHFQEGEGYNVWNNVGGQQAIGMNLQDGDYGFFAELRRLENLRGGVINMNWVGRLEVFPRMGGSPKWNTDIVATAKERVTVRARNPTVDLGRFLGFPSMEPRVMNTVSMARGDAGMAFGDGHAMPGLGENPTSKRRCWMASEKGKKPMGVAVGLVGVASTVGIVGSVFVSRVASALGLNGGLEGILGC